MITASAYILLRNGRVLSTGSIQDNKPKDLAKAERLHRKDMETEQKVTDTINNMPALFMPTVD